MISNGNLLNFPENLKGEDRATLALFVRREQNTRPVVIDVNRHSGGSRAGSYHRHQLRPPVSEGRVGREAGTIVHCLLSGQQAEGKGHAR